MSPILLYLLKLLQMIGYAAIAAGAYLLLISAIGIIGGYLHHRNLRVKIRNWEDWKRRERRRG